MFHASLGVHPYQNIMHACRKSKTIHCCLVWVPENQPSPNESNSMPKWSPWSTHAPPRILEPMSTFKGSILKILVRNPHDCNCLVSTPKRTNQATAEMYIVEEGERSHLSLELTILVEKRRRYIKNTNSDTMSSPEKKTTSACWRWYQLLLPWYRVHRHEWYTELQGLFWSGYNGLYHIHTGQPTGKLERRRFDPKRLHCSVSAWVWNARPRRGRWASFGPESYLCCFWPS